MYSFKILIYLYFILNKDLVAIEIHIQNTRIISSQHETIFTYQM